MRNSNVPGFTKDDPLSLLDEMAMDIVGDMLTRAINEQNLEDSGIKELAIVVNSYTRFRTVMSNDAGYIIDSLSRMTEKQLKVLEGHLKKQALIENFKRGKLSLDEVYKLGKTDK